MLQNNESVSTQLIDAINRQDTLTVKRLLNQGVSPKGGLDSANVTPLHFAAQHNAVDMIKMLLLAGADLKETTQPDGETAYDIARLHGHQEAMALLKID